MRITRYILIAGTFLVLLIFTSGCLRGIAQYQPPAIPLNVSIDTDGKISFTVEGKVSVPTPLGTFSAGVEIDPAKKFNVESVLTIRVDDRQDYFYDLNGKDFDIRFESGFYEKVQVTKTGANIFLEIKRKSEYQSQWLVYHKPTAAPPAPVTSPNPVVTINNYQDQSLGGVGKIRIIILASGQPVTNETVYIQRAEKDIVGTWSVRSDWGSGFRVGSRDGMVEIAKDPGTYLIWLSSTQGNWGINGKVDGNGKQVLPVDVQASMLTEVRINLSVLNVGLISNRNAIVNGSVNVYMQITDAAGNPTLGQNVASGNTDNTGVVRVIVPAGNYMVEYSKGFWGNECQYFNVIVQVGQVQDARFEINDLRSCIR